MHLISILKAGFPGDKIVIAIGLAGLLSSCSKNDIEPSPDLSNKMSYLHSIREEENGDWRTVSTQHNILDLETGELSAFLSTGHPGRWVNGFFYYHDDDTLWRKQMGAASTEFVAHISSVRDFDVSLDERLVAFAEYCGQPKFIDLAFSSEFSLRTGYSCGELDATIYHDVQFSPDSRKILMTRDTVANFDGELKVWTDFIIADLNTGDIIEIPNRTLFKRDQASWSPGGGGVLYPIQGSLYYFDLKTSAVSDLTPTDMFPVAPTYSPDRNFIAFSHYNSRDPDGLHQLILLDTRSFQTNVLDQDDGWQPVWFSFNTTSDKFVFQYGFYNDIKLSNLHTMETSVVLTSGSGEEEVHGSPRFLR